MFVKPDRTYDLIKLKEITKVITRNLNKIIDVNYYPVPEVWTVFFGFLNSLFLLNLSFQAKRSNFRHRPIGIGVQGLADAFILMRYPFDSEEAQLLNKQIFETIYYGALESSCELAEQFGTYESYPGCPVSKGVRRCFLISVLQIR